MKKFNLVVVLFVLLLPVTVNAQRGCCSHHGGVAGCSSGRQVCNDGTLSPTCTCSSTTSNNESSNYSQPEIKKIYGCTDADAYNYNSSANINDGSCIAKKYGCMDSNAINYDLNANISNDSCLYKKEVIEKEKIKYKTKYKKNKNKKVGTKKVLKKGKKGLKNVTYSITYDKNNNIISKEKIKEDIIKKAKNKVVEKGIKKGLFD